MEERITQTSIKGERETYRLTKEKGQGVQKAERKELKEQTIQTSNKVERETDRLNGDRYGRKISDRY